MTVLGASLLEDRVAFTVWAPRCRSVDVVVEGRRPEPLIPGAGGLYQATLARVAPGARYHYRLDNARFRPDPASRWQPEGVHGASVVVDPGRFMWTDQDFRGMAPPAGPLRGDPPDPRPDPRPRRDRAPAHADRRVPGLAQRGLRRRPPVREPGN